MRTNVTRKHKGFSLIELLGTLAVIAILAAIVLNGLNRAEANANATGLRQQSLSLVTAIKQAYPLGSNPNGRYTGLSAANLIQSRLAPDEMINGTSLQHQDGGTVVLTPVTVNSVTNAGGQAVFNNIAGDSCTTMVNAIRESAQSVTVGTTVVKDQSTTFDPSVLNTACNAERVNVTIVLT